MLTLRSLWRATGKPWLRSGQNWMERQRYPDLFGNSLSAEEAGGVIQSAIKKEQPFCAARMGHVEARILGEARLRCGRWSRATHAEAHANAGIFPVTDAGLLHFADVYGEALESVDLLGFWQTDYQAALVASVQHQPLLCSLASLESFRQSDPWSKALFGRRVLVVHPFVQSIEDQYKRCGGNVFADRRVLPLFDLQVLRPPCTHAPSTEGYESWLDALESLQSRVLDLSFDVALIGCGAYGLPLAAAVKRSGRQAIHLGGALQLLFGIRGRRWDDDPAISSMINDHWVRPRAEETPASALSIERGCYW
jgi:hypothetical protein